MRVIAGTARRTQLKTVEGMDTRPTTDRIKETLFNMLQMRLADCEFLDLFSGSGAIGIEALSRGAKSAVFIEQNLSAVNCIRQNLKATQLDQFSHVYHTEVLMGLKMLESEGRVFDFIFMDPPYGKELEKRVLEWLKNSRIVYSNTELIIETSIETDFTYLEGLGFMVKKKKKYKSNMHVFIQRIEN